MARKKKVIEKTIENVIDNTVPSIKEEFIVVDPNNRKTLHEGRNFGVGFAFIRRDGNTLNLFTSCSACREYLNDFVWSQQTGKSCSAYGFKSEPVKDIFSYNEFYMAMSVLPYQSGDKYVQYDRDLQALEENYQKCQELINYFEKEFKLKQLTKITKLKDNLFLVTCDLFWTDATYKISLLSLLLRNGIFYQEGDFMEFLNKTNEDGQDTYSIKAAIPKLQKMLNGVVPKQDLSKLKDVHSMGIVNFEFPS